MAREQRGRSRGRTPERVPAPSDPGETSAVESAPAVRWPVWPTSQPGPWSTPPLPGMRPLNAWRPEQTTALDSAPEEDVAASANQGRPSGATRGKKRL